MLCLVYHLLTVCIHNALFGIQVQDMYVEIQTTCAECLFSLACQRPLKKDDTLQLISHLKAANSLQADGSLSHVTQSLLMALLYCFDVSVLEREDAEGMCQTIFFIF